jgi:hypothetical protein
MKRYTRLKNLQFRLQGNPFRLYVHPTQLVENLVIQQGFQQRFYHRTGAWQIAIYERRHPLASSPIPL